MPPSRIAVTGAAGYIGRHLVAALAQQAWVETILAVDVRPVPLMPPKVVPLQHDVAHALPWVFEGALRSFGIQAIVPLAFQLRPGRNRQAVRQVNVGGLESTLKACAAAGVHQVLYLSSSTVYGAHPDNPIPLTEDAPLRPNAGFQYAEDKVEAEKLLVRWGQENPHTTVTILRGCPVMGPGADNFVARALSKPLLPACVGHDPPLQFLHMDDQVSILLRMLKEPVSGTFNLAGEGTLLWSALARLAGRPLIRLPCLALEALTEGSWRLRLQRDSSAVGLAFIRWPFVVSTHRLTQATGWKPRYTVQQAVEAFLQKAAVPV
ncbi:MAG: NAD-dependent epimerase/dehydratase family protein [Chloroflexota bacterium]|nr:NAD-dependent epimerase/dehydratase family protein [Chloroflexota bacterium]